MHVYQAMGMVFAFMIFFFVHMGKQEVNFSQFSISAYLAKSLAFKS